MPSDTASNTPNAGTSSSASNSRTVTRPSVAVVMRSATRAAEVPNPGKFFGNEVTSFNSVNPFDTAGAATAAAAAAVPADTLVVRN